MGNGTGVFRIFRIARLFKLVQGAKGLRTLFNTLLQSLPAIGNVGSLLFLLMFVYGVLGMNMYGKPGTVLYDAQHANFNDFATSLNTLFRVFTGDSWSAIMKEAFECADHGGCANHERGRTLDGAIAAIYFISFVVAGDVSDSNEPVQLEQRQKIADVLGVSIGLVALSASAASVRSERPFAQ